jgi:hypothetical protein
MPPSKQHRKIILRKETIYFYMMENSYQFARFRDTEDYKRCLRLHERTEVHEEALKIKHYTLQKFLFFNRNFKMRIN